MVAEPGKGSSGTQEFKLRAMALNYSNSHSWDHLDSETCLKAAAEICDLRARYGNAAQAAAASERFIQASIEQAPEPLRRLGGYLASVLDEDQWRAAERMLLASAAAQQEASCDHSEHVRPADGVCVECGEIVGRASVPASDGGGRQ